MQLTAQWDEVLEKFVLKDTWYSTHRTDKYAGPNATFMRPELLVIDGQLAPRMPLVPCRLQVSSIRGCIRLDTNVGEGVA